jgi:hypothetical protein
MRLSALLLLPLLFLSACAESLEHFHRGDKIVERHHMPGTWGVPGNTSYTECRPEQMVHSKFWGKKVCPDSIDSNATLAVDRGYVQTPNYASLVVPSAIQAAGMVGMGGLISHGLQNQNVSRMTQSVTNQYRNSTMYANPTPVPSWLGE